MEICSSKLLTVPDVLQSARTRVNQTSKGNIPALDRVGNASLNPACRPVDAMALTYLEVLVAYLPHKAVFRLHCRIGLEFQAGLRNRKFQVSIVVLLRLINRSEPLWPIKGRASLDQYSWAGFLACNLLHLDTRAKPRVAHRCP
jgi:hypothetical protein